MKTTDVWRELFRHSRNKTIKMNAFLDVLDDLDEALALLKEAHATLSEYEPRPAKGSVARRIAAALDGGA